MTDIYIGIAIVLLAAELAGFGAYRLARRGWRWTAVVLALLAAAGLALNVAFFRNSIWPARWLPFSNVIVLGDPNPWLAGILVGVGAALMPGSPARRSVLLAPLAVLCLWGSYGGFFMRPPPLADHWTGRVCRQTSQATCGPAAAATLLAAYGIKSSEGEMAQLCLTNIDGTSTRGVYRGLKLKTRDKKMRVEPYLGKIEDLCKVEGPVLLFVRLDSRAGVDPRYQSKWGWQPGVAHTVVMYRYRSDGRFLMGDPAVGAELWDRKAIETLWHGEGIRLVKE
jgi:predicted double-glycine peptidase